METLVPCRYCSKCIFEHAFREEVFDQYLFLRLGNVRELAHWWMIECSGPRQHDSPGDLTPPSAQQVAGSFTFEVSLATRSCRWITLRQRPHCGLLRSAVPYHAARAA